MDLLPDVRAQDKGELKMVKRERYVLAAFSIDEEKAVKDSTYYTKRGLGRGVSHAIDAMQADYISIRIIRPKESRR